MARPDVFETFFLDHRDRFVQPVEVMCRRRAVEIAIEVIRIDPRAPIPVMRHAFRSVAGAVRLVGEIDEAMLRPQREEVAELAFIPLEQLKNEWDHSPQNWVGHSKYYYQWLLRFAETSAIASSKKR